MNINTIDLIFCLICLCIFVIGTIALYVHGTRRTIGLPIKIGTSKQGLLDSIKHLNKWSFKVISCLFNEAFLYPLKNSLHFPFISCIINLYRLARQLPNKGNKMNTVYTNKVNNQNTITIVQCDDGWLELYLNGMFKANCISWVEALKEEEELLHELI